MATTNTRIVIRRDLASTWETVNPELLTGEQGFETDTGKFKIGEGKTWNATGYAAYLPSEVDAKVDDEATVRAAADTNLQTNIDDETAAREAADAALAADIVSTQEFITVETTARGAADEQLSLDIEAEAVARADADEVLDGRIDAEITARGLAFDALEADIQTNTTAIATEASTRESADDALGARIDSEVTAREGGDSALSGRLDVLEADPTTGDAVALKADITYVDGEISTVNDRVDTERDARIGADDALTLSISGLGDRLDVLEADPTTGDAVAAVASDLADVVDGTTPVAIATSATSAESAVKLAYTDLTGADIPNTAPAAVGTLGIESNFGDVYLSISDAAGGWIKVN